MTPLDYPVWLRATHFFNLPLLTPAGRRGLEILSAHPKLYWNDVCRPGSELIGFTKRKQPLTINPIPRQIRPDHEYYSPEAGRQMPSRRTPCGS